MKYSLIIPHFNDVERLDRLLCTVSIDRPDVEVIVVDDCSPDQSAIEEVTARWPRVRWLSTPENAGAGVARNVGMGATQGCWLVFADSDDKFLPGAFDTFDLVLRADDEMVYFLVEAVQKADDSQSVRSERMNDLVTAYAMSSNEGALERLRLQHVVPWAKGYSSAFIKGHEVRFDPIRRSNDVAFNVLAAVQAGRLRADVTSVYRIYRRAQSQTADVSATAFVKRFLADRSVAQRLAAPSARGVRSVTGTMLLSVRCGPRVALQVWLVAICATMQIVWARIFDLKRWRRFVTNQPSYAQEQSK